MKLSWKEIFLIAIIVVVLIFVIQIILSGIAYWWISGTLREGIGPSQLGTDIQLIDVSCIPNSHYTLTLKNVGTKTVTINNLNFYIDKSRVTCEGITSLEPGISATCRISQFTTRGSHTLDVSGPNFSMGQSVDC